MRKYLYFSIYSIQIPCTRFTATHQIPIPIPVPKHQLEYLQMAYQTLASDVLVLAAGAATFTAVAMAAKHGAPFRTSLGTEGDDDSLCTPLPEEKKSTSSIHLIQEEEEKETVQETKVLNLGDIEKKVVTMVTVEEVGMPLTPMAEVVELRLDADCSAVVV